MFLETQQQTIWHKTNKTSVLVIDRDKAVRRFLRTALSAYGYRVKEAATGQEGIEQFTSFQPDLILMDLDLPDKDGIEVMQGVRKCSMTPILILSIPNHDIDIVEALDSGANDYIAKPFSIHELMARMRVALRQVQTTNPISVFAVGDLQVDLTARLVEVKGEYISLTPTEYDLLRVLVIHAGKVVTHQQVWQQIRGDAEAVDSHLIQVHMSNLRRKVEDDATDPRHILTIPGVGYRLWVKD